MEPRLLLELSCGSITDDGVQAPRVAMLLTELFDVHPPVRVSEESPRGRGRYTFTQSLNDVLDPHLVLVPQVLSYFRRLARDESGNSL
jgi:hypothetical protein